MNKEFIPYEQALALKELGFDELCSGFYTYKGEIRRYTNFDGELNDFQSIKNSDITMGDNWCIVPLYQQAFRWFRNEHGLTAAILYLKSEGAVWTIASEEHEWTPDVWWETYEEAEQACLDKLIQIVKDKVIK
jgi:hypothetical protein